MHRPCFAGCLHESTGYGRQVRPWLLVHLVAGGVTFAASPRAYGQKVNRKMYRAALRSIMSELARQDRLDNIIKITPPAEWKDQIPRTLIQPGYNKPEAPGEN